MPKYQVPQFIETETKLIGPLTLKQFLFVTGGISSVAMEFIILGSSVWFWVLALPTLAFFGALAWVKVDGQPFLNYLAYMLSYMLGSKRYVYKPKQDKDMFNG